MRLFGLVLVASILASGAAHATIDFVFLSRDLYDADPAVMDQNLGIAGLEIEDFEDPQLLDGFTLTINNTAAAAAVQNGTYTNDNAFITRFRDDFPDQYWDGSGVAGALNGTVTIDFEIPMGIFGIGIAGWVDGPGGMTFTVNGTTSITGPNVPGSYVADNLGRDAYLLITASGGDVIDTVSLEFFVPPSDGGFLDHMAFAAPRSNIAAFEPLGDLPLGSFSSRAEAVSGDGSVVVGTGNVDAGDEAFRWTEQTGIVGLGDLPGGSGSSALAVSAGGTVIVGGATSGSGPEAFRWSAGTMIGLGDLAGGPFESGAFGVSADGAVVVGSGRVGVPVGETEAFRWTAGGGMVSLGDLPGGLLAGSARAASANGSVVVGTGDSGQPEAFRWTEGSGLVGLGFLPGGSQSFAHDVSADGAIVVGTSESPTEAFRWEADVMTGLGDLPGGTFSSRANATSDAGSLVVGVSTSASGDEAFVWDASHGMQRLRELLAAELGVDLTGWTLTEATDVSGDGRTIVGVGTNPAGDTEAWLARVPLADEYEALASGAQTVSLLGGVEADGGLEMTLDSGGGTAVAQYETPSAREVNESFDLESVPDFHIPSPNTKQIWDVEFLGTPLSPIALVFRYDELLLDDKIPETSLLIVHQLDGGGFEVFRPGSPGFSIDPVANTISLTVSSFSQFVLGTTVGCRDGVDNDADARTDFPDDPGCFAAIDGVEQSAELPCDDGVNNDGDAFTDYPADPGCFGLDYFSESPQCDDGINNDPSEDALVDLDDPGCRSAADPLETSAYGCGLGGELVTPLLLVAWLIRHRRRSYLRESGSGFEEA